MVSQREGLFFLCSQDGDTDRAEERKQHMEQIEGGLDLIWLLFVVTRVAEMFTPGDNCWRDDGTDWGAGVFPICLGICMFVLAFDGVNCKSGVLCCSTRARSERGSLLWRVLA